MGVIDMGLHSAVGLWSRLPGKSNRHSQSISLERQPWREFRPSVAVQFRSDRLKSWSPSLLSSEFKREALAGLEAREVIRRSFGIVDSALFDLVRSAKRMSAVRNLDLGSRGGHPGRLADAEAIVAAIGPGLPDFQLVTALLRELRAQDAALDLLVFGFVTVRESRSGKVSFVFENARGRRTWTAAGLEDFAALLESMAANAERLQEAAEGLE